MLQKKVLVKGITSLSEARFCAGMLVDFITFEFDSTAQNYLSSEKFTEIKNWLSGISIVGQGQNLNVSEIQSLINTHSLDGFLFTENQMEIAKNINCNLKFIESNADEIDFSIADFVIKTDTMAIESLKNPEQTLIGFNFDNIKYRETSIAGFAFLGSNEMRTGQGNYDELINSLEILDED